MRRSMLIPVLVMAGAGLVQCSATEGDRDRAWQVVPESTMTADQTRLKQQALDARATLFGRLSRELTTAMEASGPGGAVLVCREAAPRIAAEISAERGLRIGRTSFRLRNPENTAPDWARATLETRPEQPTFLLGPGGALGALLPIRMAGMCVDCHGPADNLSPELRESLAAAYPQDEATGFIPGDLRGWFWVEVGNR